MKRQSVTIHPSSGRLTVDFTVDADAQTCLIEFGHSFTLRLEEHDANQLREALHNAVRELCITRRDTTDLCGKKFAIAEEDFVQQGIDAREASRRQKQMKGTTTAPSWDPNDPSNW